MMSKKIIIKTRGINYEVTRNNSFGHIVGPFDLKIEVWDGWLQNNRVQETKKTYLHML